MSEYPMGTTCGCEHGLSCTTISVCKAESINTDLKNELELSIDKLQTKIEELEIQLNESENENDLFKAQRDDMDATLTRVAELPEKWRKQYSFEVATRLVNQTVSDCAYELEAALKRRR